MDKCVLLLETRTPLFDSDTGNETKAYLKTTYRMLVGKDAEEVIVIVPAEVTSISIENLEEELQAAKAYMDKYS